MLDFILRLGNITLELSRLLTIRFAPGNPNSETQIGKQVASLIPLWNSGRREECEFELIKLAYLAKHLGEIEEADPKLLSHFRREFRRSGKILSYYGIRFEAYIAASLIRSGVQFIKSETPDFLIAESKLGLECTSTRVNAGHGKSDLTYKIQSALTKKAKTASNRPEIALLIDITNIAHNLIDFDIQAIRTAIYSSLLETKFGAVVLFVHLFNHDLSQYETNYLRIDGQTIISSLKSLLDHLYPLKVHEVREYKIPTEG